MYGDTILSLLREDADIQPDARMNYSYMSASNYLRIYILFTFLDTISEIET